MVIEKDLVSENIPKLEKSLAIAKCDEKGELLVLLKGKNKGKAAKAAKEPKDPKDEGKAETKGAKK